MSHVRMLFTLAAVALVGCESPQDKTMKAEEARHAADQKVAEVTQATQEKEADIRQKADEEAARVQRDGARKVDEAEGKARVKEVAADNALLKARGEARDASSAKLVRLDKEIMDLRVRLEKKLGSSAVTSLMDDLRAKAAAARTSIADLDLSTADTLDTFKKAVDARLDDLEQAISSARKRA